MRVFISHSRQNSGVALHLSEALRKHGLETWLDVEQISSGNDWDGMVADAIRSSGAFAFVIGPPGGATDRWQHFEWQQVVQEEYFLDPSKALVPVIIDDAEIPGFLKTRHPIHVASAAIGVDEVADRIAESVKRPAATIDQENLKRGKQARAQAMKSLTAYARNLAERDVKLAGVRALK